MIWEQFQLTYDVHRTQRLQLKLRNDDYDNDITVLPQGEPKISNSQTINKTY